MQRKRKLGGMGRKLVDFRFWDGFWIS